MQEVQVLVTPFLVLQYWELNHKILDRPFSFQCGEQYDEKGSYPIAFTCLHFSHCLALSSLNLCVDLKFLISKTNKFGLRYNNPTGNWSCIFFSSRGIRFYLL